MDEYLPRYIEDDTNPLEQPGERAREIEELELLSYLPWDIFSYSPDALDLALGGLSKGRGGHRPQYKVMEAWSRAIRKKLGRE